MKLTEPHECFPPVRPVLNTIVPLQPFKLKVAQASSGPVFQRAAKEYDAHGKHPLPLAPTLEYINVLPPLVYLLELPANPPQQPFGELLVTLELHAIAGATPVKSNAKTVRAVASPRRRFRASGRSSIEYAFTVICPFVRSSRNRDPIPVAPWTIYVE